MDTYWISRLMIFRPDVVPTMKNCIDITHRVVNYRQFWKKLNFHQKRLVVVFCIGIKNYLSIMEHLVGVI